MPTISPVPNRPVAPAPAPSAGNTRTPAESVAWYKKSLGYTDVMAWGSVKDYAKVKELLDQGADPNGVVRGRKFYKDTSNVFHAAQQNDPLLMKLLLDAGASPDFKSSDGCTPLMYAAIHGNVALVKLLLAAGADVNAKDDRNATALHIARKGSNPELVAVLERAGGKDFGEQERKQPMIERAIGAFLNFLRPGYW